MLEVQIESKYTEIFRFGLYYINARLNPRLQLNAN